MTRRNFTGRCWLAAGLASVCLVTLASAQQPPAREPFRPPGVLVRPRVQNSQRPSDRGVPLRLAKRPSPPADQHRAVFTPQPNEHPLMPALRWARQGLKDMEKIKDYSATMVRRDRSSGKVGEYEHIFVKIRQEPFSVYLYFIGPDEFRGREVIYVKGKNNGRMWAHGTGLQRTVFGTVSLPPTGPVAMRGQRYPLTEIGMANMLRRLIEVGEKDTKYGECEVQYFEGAKVNDRSCTCVQVTHPVPRRNFLFNVARIYVDDKLNLPVRYEAYDWPAKPGGEPLLSEEYTFLDVKVNNGFTDADFDTRNSDYNFP